jgi:lactoylglutathione lyase
MPSLKRARAIGLNHVALEVGDIEEALTFYGKLFDFELRGKCGDMAFIDLGDQYLALYKARSHAEDEGRHFGLVVDDRDALREALAQARVNVLPGPFLDFQDPWGNRIEVESYDSIQFTRAANMLRGVRLSHLEKSAQALREVAQRGMAYP